MRHPSSIWTEPDNADYPLSELLDAYRLHLANRAKPVAAGTITAYTRRLASFMRSLRLHQEELVLGSITPFNVERWIADMRAGLLVGCPACGARAGAACTDGRGQPGERHPQRKRYTEETVASAVSVIKSFTRKYIYRALDMTRRDLLERVERFQPPLRVEDGYSQGELDQLLTVNEGSDKYTDVRDRALVAFYAASGLRFSEVIRLAEDQVDKYSGRVRTVGKGDRGREVKIGERALKALRRYLHVRRAKDGVAALWTTDEGKALSYDGGQKIFKRLKTKVDVRNIHAHRFRHTWAQTALKKGAERALVQDQMGWSSDQMVRRYAGFVRGKLAAELMPQFAPI